MFIKFISLLFTFIKNLIIKVCFLLSVLRLVYYVIALKFDLNFFLFSKYFPIQIIFSYSWLYYIAIFFFILLIFILFIYRNYFFVQVFFFIFLYGSEAFLAYFFLYNYSDIPWDPDTNLFKIIPIFSDVVIAKMGNCPTPNKLQVLNKVIVESNSLPRERYLEFLIILIIPALASADPFQLFDFISPIALDLESIYINQMDFIGTYNDFQQVVEEAYGISFDEASEVLNFKYKLLQFYFFLLSWENFFLGLLISFIIWLIKELLKRRK